MVVKKSKRKGANIPGYILIGIALLTIAIDLIIQNLLSIFRNTSLLEIAYSDPWDAMRKLRVILE